MIGQIFLRVFSQSKILSGAFGASNNSASPEGGGGSPPTAPPTPPKGKLWGCVCLGIWDPKLDWVKCHACCQEVAQCKMGDAEMPVYTKLLDDFETGMAESRINELFSTVQTALVPLIAKVLASKAQPDTSALHGTFPLDKQEELNKAVVQALGFEGRQVCPLCWQLPSSNTCPTTAPDLPLASAKSDMMGWSRVLLSHTLDAARSY